MRQSISFVWGMLDCFGEASPCIDETVVVTIHHSNPNYFVALADHPVSIAHLCNPALVCWSV